MKLDKLKELFGERYDEVADVIEGVADKLMVRDGTYIPKSRFDEVNTQLREYKDAEERKRVENLTKEEQLAEAMQEAEALKREFLVKSNKLDIEKKFIESGINGYDKYIDNIVNEDLEKSLSVAEGIISNFKEMQIKHSEELEKVKVSSTIAPEVGGDEAPKFTKLNMTEQASLKQSNPREYEEYVKWEDTQN